MICLCFQNVQNYSLNRADQKFVGGCKTLPYKNLPTKVGVEVSIYKR